MPQALQHRYIEIRRLQNESGNEFSYLFRSQIYYIVPCDYGKKKYYYYYCLSMYNIFVVVFLFR